MFLLIKASYLHVLNENRNSELIAVQRDSSKVVTFVLSARKLHGIAKECDHTNINLTSVMS